MKKQAKPLELRLYGGRTMLSWEAIGYCGVAGLGLLIATNTSGIDALGRGILFVVFAVCFAGIIITLIRGMIGQHDRPTFYANRNGFRIMSWRMRVWRDFHGARVVALRGQYGEVAEKVQIKVRPSGLFAYRTTAVLGSDDYGQGMVDRIIVFKHKLEDLWAQEAERVDLGMSPVVAARELRNRTPKAPVSIWQSGVEKVAGLLGRTQKR